MNRDVDENRSNLRKNSVLTRAQADVNVIYHSNKSNQTTTFSIRKRKSLAELNLFSVSKIVKSTPEYIIPLLDVILIRFFPPSIVTVSFVKII